MKHMPMGMRIWTAAVSAMALISATPAYAGLWDINVSGDFNDDPIYAGWDAKAVMSDDPSLNCLGCWEDGYYWSHSGSNVLMARITVYAFDGGVTRLDLINPSVTVHRFPNVFLVDFSGSNGFATRLGTAYGAAPVTEPNASASWNGWGDYGSWSIPGTGDPHAHGIWISAHVPEPSTWGLMILGFGTAGAMLRRRPVAEA